MEPAFIEYILILVILTAFLAVIFAINPWIYVKIENFILRRSERTFCGEVILITGASRGLGRALAREVLYGVAGEPCKPSGVLTKLILIDKRRNELEECVKELEALPWANIAIHSFICDLGSNEELANTLSAVKAQIYPSKVGVVVNNAGVVIGKPCEKLSVKDFEKTLQVNTVAHFAIIKEFLPDMLERNQGLIVTIASMMGLFGGAQLVDYCASKSAVIGMHESLRLEIRKKGSKNVRMLVVCPYILDTKMFKGAFEGQGLWLQLVRFWFPRLKTEKVAKRIVYAMRNSEQFITIPFYMSIIPRALHLLPASVMDLILSTFGGTDGMEGFVGYSSKNE